MAARWGRSAVFRYPFQKQQKAILRSHKQVYVFFRSMCVCLLCVTVFCADGCARTEKNEPKLETKTFSVPQSYRISSSSAAGIHSLYIYDANDKQYALIAEENSQADYTKERYLEYLEEECSNQVIASNQTIETDAMIACRTRTSGRLKCYIHAKQKNKNISITFRTPDQDQEATRGILHSYLESIGEKDANYMYSDFLIKTEEDKKENGSSQQRVSGQKESVETVKPNSEAKQQGSNSLAGQKNSEESNDAAISKDDVKRHKTADDFIIVIDKSASHSDQ